MMVGSVKSIFADELLKEKDDYIRKYGVFKFQYSCLEKIAKKYKITLTDDNKRFGYNQNFSIVVSMLDAHGILKHYYYVNVKDEKTAQTVYDNVDYLCLIPRMYNSEGRLIK